MLMADFLNSCRIAANDGPESNYSGAEDCLVHEQNRLDGISTVFYLLNKRVIPTSLIIVNNGVPMDVATCVSDFKSREGLVFFFNGKQPLH